MITVRQIKAARALAGWDQGDLANRAGLSKTGIANIESERNRPTPQTLNAITTAFWDAGFEFADDGVRPRKDLVRILEGHAGFHKFLDEVYDAASKEQKILVSGAIEEKFVEFAGDKNKTHISRMEKLGKKTVKSINIDTGIKLQSSYCDFKFIDEKMISAIPFYIYGDKVAIILWAENCRILILRDTELTRAFRKQFEILWSLAVT